MKKINIAAIYRWPLQWRHNGRDGVSNRQPRDCLLKRLFRCRSKKTSKLRVTGLCEGNSPGPVNSPHKGPVTRKMFPFDDVIMYWAINEVEISEVVFQLHTGRIFVVNLIKRNSDVNHFRVLKCHVTINLLRPADSYMRHQPRPSLVPIMACGPFGTKPLSELNVGI